MIRELDVNQICTSRPVNGQFGAVQFFQHSSEVYIPHNASISVGTPDNQSDWPWGKRIMVSVRCGSIVRCGHIDAEQNHPVDTESLNCVLFTDGITVKRLPDDA